MKININSSISIKSSKEDIFKIISDHEGTSNWVDKVEHVKLLKEGNPKNGLGAIREVNFKPKFWTTVQERITLFEDNSRFQYKLIKMAGVKDHLGEFLLEESINNEITVHWNVFMHFKKYHIVKLIAPKFGKDFKKTQEEGLLKLKSILES